MLQICEYSDDRCTVEGGKKLLLFCEKVTKEDIEVHFLQYTKSKKSSGPVSRSSDICISCQLCFMHQRSTLA